MFGLPQHYVINKIPNPTGEHEVHALSCTRLPALHNQVPLGVFYDCKGAVEEATKRNFYADGCWHCSLLCHTK